MTREKFLTEALLQLLGNSAYKCNWHSRKKWKQSIYTTLEIAFQIARDNNLIDDEPDEPP